MSQEKNRSAITPQTPECQAFWKNFYHLVKPGVPFANASKWMPAESQNAYANMVQSQMLFLQVLAKGCDMSHRHPYQQPTATSAPSEDQSWTQATEAQKTPEKEISR